MKHDTRKVKLPGIPVEWWTNLTDTDLREIYLELVEDVEFRKAVREPCKVSQIKLWGREIEWREGVCICTGLPPRIAAIWKTRLEWETQIARREDQEQLRKETRRKRKPE